MLLGVVAGAALAVASAAAAAFTPSLAVGHTPPTAGSSGTTAVRVTVPRDDDALFRAQIYVAPGYTANLTQAPGSQLGTVTAQVRVREPIDGAVLPLTGTIVVTDQATVGAAGAQCTGTPVHAAYWVLVLQASGQELRVPMFVDPASGAVAAVASHVLTVCLPSPHIPVAAGGATFGAKLIQAQLNLRGVFTAPTGSASHRWNVVATPWPNGPGLPNAAGTVSAQAVVSLPAAVSLAATSRKRVVTIRGRVTEAGSGIAGQQVTLRVGTRSYRARTNASGAYRLAVRVRKGARVAVRATVAVPARSAACTTPSPFPVPCVGETRQFFTATRSLVARVR